VKKPKDQEFYDWLSQAQPKDKFVYAVASSLPECDSLTQRVARLALQAYASGQIELVQKRLRPYVFEYIAVKRASKDKPFGFTIPGGRALA